MILMTLIRRAARHLLPGGEGTSFIDSLDPRAGTPAPRYRKGKESGFLARQPRAGMTDKSLGRALLFVVSGREGRRHPHPRVTALAKSARAAPLSLSRKRGGRGADAEPSPARHGSCEKRKSRAAFPLPLFQADASRTRARDGRQL